MDAVFHSFQCQRQCYFNFRGRNLKPRHEIINAYLLFLHNIEVQYFKETTLKECIYSNRQTNRRGLGSDKIFCISFKCIKTNMSVKFEAISHLTGSIDHNPGDSKMYTFTYKSGSTLQSVRAFFYKRLDKGSRQILLGGFFPLSGYPIPRTP